MTSRTILSEIGNTPLVEIKHLNPYRNKGISIYAKLEYCNPGGSVKDRAVKYMVLDALEKGQLRNRVLLDATSGNTGIAEAMLAHHFGLEALIVMPENATKERRDVIQKYGALVELTPAAKGSNGAIERAQEIYRQNPQKYFYADQYNNPNNIRAHQETTGPEIWQQTAGKVTHFVACVGTSGTATGTGYALKEFNHRTKVYEVQPNDELHGIDGLKYMGGNTIIPSLYDECFFDGFFGVRTEDALDLANLIHSEEGYFVGPSSGAALKGALHLAKQLNDIKCSDAAIVTIFPDGGERYLSTHFLNQKS
ncbi:cysteine synthase family protein [Candidatus Woesearchaeota archaeon]|nr:cysteine synthase family protein [Candidatus Woesearchaeota archaeon]